MVVGTAAVALSLPEIFSTAAHGVFMATTYDRHFVYMQDAHEISPEDNVWAARGCNEWPCDDETSLYYRIKPSFLHHVWSLAVNKNFFFADYVAGAIPAVPSKCDIESYGFRGKFFVRNFEVFPYIMSVHSCVPLSPAQADLMKTPRPN